MVRTDSRPINKENASFLGKLKNGYNPMMEGVRWAEQYATQIEKLWKYIPNWLGQTLVFISIFLFATGIQGDWILILVHCMKYMRLQNIDNENNTETKPVLTLPGNENGSLPFFIFVSALGSYAIYFAIGGFLHWYFYVRQRDKSHEWKCQPEKFLTPELERHEIVTGSLSLAVVSILTGTITWYAANDGKYLTVYYRADEYGWIWFFLQIPIVFIYQDYAAYWVHRIYHNPYLYKKFHKVHHKYVQPTAFSVTAIHPVEIIHMQLTLALPMVIVPVHWILFYTGLIYIYYHGIIVHSGIAFKAHWWQPWQPDAIFHDNHHQYFHVNFGFNLSLWDKLHGTYRQKNRVYSENIFNGKGKALNEVTPEELAQDLAERKSENPHAYRSNSNENALSEQDLKFKLKSK